MRYHQLTSEERYALSTLRKQGWSVARIARALGRHRSTIGREIARNQRKDGGYRPRTAGTARARRTISLGGDDRARGGTSGSGPSSGRSCCAASRSCGVRSRSPAAIGAGGFCGSATRRSTDTSGATGFAAERSTGICAEHANRNGSAMGATTVAGAWRESA